MRQPLWDKYETALLIEAYWKIKANGIEKNEAVTDLSLRLRNRADFDIDEIYRNENGIRMRLAEIDCLFNNGHHGMKNTSELFRNMTKMYVEDRETFEQILMEAKKMENNENNNQTRFIQWLEKNAPKLKPEIACKMLMIGEEFCLKMKVLSCPLFETIDIKTIKRFFQTISENKVFLMQNRKNHAAIINAAYLYSRFLKTELLKQTEKTYPASDGVEFSLIDNVLDYFSEISEQYPELVFTNINAIGNENRHTVYIYPRDLERRGNVLFEIWQFSIGGKFDLYIKRSLLSDEEYEESLKTWANTTEFRGRITRIWNRKEDLISFLRPKIEKANLEMGGRLIGSEGSPSLNEPETTSLNSGIIEILRSNFQYGLRIDSVRELMRFRQFADSVGISLPTDDNELRNQILSIGTRFEDKVYYVSEDMPQELRKMVDDIFMSGVQTIYYECLLEEKSNWMTRHVITSEEMLKEYLQKHLESYSFSKKFMVCGSRQTEKEIVTAEMKRVWGENPIESVEMLSEKLPYIPTGNIWRVISGNDSFVIVSEGKYLWLDRFIISDEEKCEIRNFVRESIEKNGYCSLNEIPMEDIEENNYEIPHLSILNAVYKKVLATDYSINGRVLTKDGSSLDAISLLKQCIIGKEGCTFSEADEKMNELIGESNRQYVFQALYSCMIRIDANRFVSDKYITFDVNQIDDVLSQIINNHFCALKDVTTFALFPICGMPWNHYLLESYCYRFSQKYVLHVMNFNDKNAGIVAEKSFNKSYKEMLAIVTEKSGIALEPETIGNYLNQSGYLAKSKYGSLGEIANMAKMIREGK